MIEIGCFDVDIMKTDSCSLAINSVEDLSRPSVKTTLESQPEASTAPRLLMSSGQASSTRCGQDRPSCDFETIALVPVPDEVGSEQSMQNIVPSLLEADSPLMRPLEL